MTLITRGCIIIMKRKPRVLFRKCNATEPPFYGQDNGGKARARARAWFLSRPCTVNLAGTVMTHLRNEMIPRDVTATKFFRRRDAMPSSSLIAFRVAICGVCEYCGDNATRTIVDRRRPIRRNISSFMPCVRAADSCPGLTHIALRR